LLPPAIERANANIRGQGNPPGRPPQERLSSRLLNPEGWRRDFPASAPVLVFLGCAVSYLDPQLLGSMLHLLDAAGLDYTLLGEREMCCGLPLAQAGDAEAFRRHAASLAALIREAKPQLIITPCPACLKALGSLYPPAVAGWDLEVRSLVEYLHEIIGSRGLQFTRPLEKRVSYHDPCLLARCRGIIDQPRQLLARVPGISLVEFPKSKKDAWCCGGGNGLPGAAPEIAGAMAAWRLSQAMEAGAQMIATACPTCKRQLLKGLEKFGREKLPVLDISEILHLALNEV
jgi:glycolate oxidase